jgi:chromosome segregation ATPase
VKPDPLVAAARRAREEKKDQAKPAKVFTNDNLPTTGGVSSVGETSASAGPDKASGSESSASLDTQEKMWREKFATLRHKLEQDQQELEVMQRELGVLDVQYYNNPVKAMQQELTRSDINKKTADIDAKKAQMEADKQALSDAEDDLRKAGGDPGWAR